MGIESSCYFQSTGGGKAATQGECALLAGEVDAVSHTLMDNGFTVTALHNHMTDVSPMLFFMHSWAAGDAVTLANGLHAALAHTNSKL
jgi:hypothetical protein